MARYKSILQFQGSIDGLVFYELNGVSVVRKKSGFNRDDFKTKEKKLRILCRDHEYVDGDRVRIYQNDNIIASDVYLTASFKEIFIDLVPGFNKIEFMALNQGTSGPNTAEFKIIDEKGNEIMGNIWNLATGVKASLIVIQE